MRALAGLFLQVIVSCDIIIIDEQTQRDVDKTALKDILADDRYEFRSMGQLRLTLNSSNDRYIRQLLQEIGVRSSFADENLLGLISRVGDKPRCKPCEFPDVIPFPSSW